MVVMKSSNLDDSTAGVVKWPADAYNGSPHFPDLALNFSQCNWKIKEENENNRKQKKNQLKIEWNEKKIVAFF